MSKKVKLIPLVCREFKQLRKAHKLTQSDLAEKANVALATIEGIEQGKDRPSKDLAEALAKILEDNPDKIKNFADRLRTEIYLDDPKSLYKLGNEQFDMGLYELASETYTKVLTFNADDETKGWVHVGLGRCLLQKKNFKGAIDALTLAIQHLPHYTLAYYDRGLAYRNLTFYDEAISDLTYFVESPSDISPLQRAWGYFRRGKTYFYQGHFEQAIMDMATTVKYMPEYGWAYHYRGTAYMTIGENSKALSDFLQVLECPNEEGNSHRQARKQLKELGTHVSESEEAYKVLVAKNKSLLTKTKVLLKGLNETDLLVLREAIDEVIASKKSQTPLAKPGLHE